MTDNATPDPSNLSPGEQLLAGRYRLLEKIGEGGAAEVFRARDERLDRDVAMKLLRSEVGLDESARARFRAEAQIAGSLSHPNVVTVFDYGSADDGTTFVAMQYVPGESLRQVVLRRGKLTSREAAQICRQVAAGLGAAHAKSIVHRDVKPQNILVDRSGVVRLADFGIVRALSTAAATTSGLGFGTPAYLAPEQALEQEVGPAADVYSMGCVLYELLGGRLPFEADNPAGVVYKQIYEEPRPLRELAPDVDGELEAIVMRCLAKDPANRFPDGGALAAALDSVATRLDRGSRDESPTAVVPVVTADATRAWTLPGATPLQRTPVAQRAVLYAQPVAPRPREGVRYERRRAQEDPAWAAPLVLLILAALAVLAGALIAPQLLGDDSAGGAAVAPTASETAQPATEGPTDEPTEEPTPEPTEAATEQPTPEPTEEPTPEPTPEPTLEPTLEPTPLPTPVPTQAPTTPPADEVAIEIADTDFAGGFTSNDGRYHGRTARWVYGRGTDFHTMTTSFRVNRQGTGRARLELTGLDSEDDPKTPMRITLNEQLFYEGPNPLPNDACCGGDGPGNWGTVVFEFPVEALRQGNNTLIIQNLDPSNRINFPIFIMVDELVIRYQRAN